MTKKSTKTGSYFLFILIFKGKVAWFQLKLHFLRETVHFIPVPRAAVGNPILPVLDLFLCHFRLPIALVVVLKCHFRLPIALEVDLKWKSFHGHFHARLSCNSCKLFHRRPSLPSFSWSYCKPPSIWPQKMLDISRYLPGTTWSWHCCRRRGSSSWFWTVPDLRNPPARLKKQSKSNVNVIGNLSMLKRWTYLIHGLVGYCHPDPHFSLDNDSQRWCSTIAVPDKTLPGFSGGSRLFQRSMSSISPLSLGTSTEIKC